MAKDAAALVKSQAKKEVDGEERFSTVNIAAGTTAAEAIELYGDQLVYDLYLRSVIIKAQAYQRSLMEAKKTDEEIDEAFKDWRPDTVRRVKKDPMDVILKGFATLTPEQKAEILDQLRG